MPRAVWLADALSNFAPYLAAFFAVALVLAASRRARLALAGASIGFVAAIAPVVQGTVLPWSDHRQEDAPSLRLMTFNLEDINSNYAGVLKYLVESPADIILLNEAFYVWRLQLIKLAPSFPWHTVLTERDLVVLSRLPLEEVEFLDVVGDRARGLLVRLRVGDRRVTVIGFHARKARHVADYELRSRQFDQIAGVVDRQSGPVIVAGDFNATSRSFAMQAFFRSSGLVPLGWHWPPISTWPSWLPYLGLQIDHVLTRGAIRVVRAEAGPELGSNHLPLIAELRLTPDARQP